MCTQNVMAESLANMHMTYYTPESCAGTITATGATVREGIAAVTAEHLGDCALIYTEDGELIGLYECLDKIGTGRSTVIDVWMPSNEAGQELVSKYGTKVKVLFVETPKG